MKFCHNGACYCGVIEFYKGNFEGKTAVSIDDILSVKRSAAQWLHGNGYGYGNGYGDGNGDGYGYINGSINGDI